MRDREHVSSRAGMRDEDVKLGPLGRPHASRSRNVHAGIADRSRDLSQGPGIVLDLDHQVERHRPESSHDLGGWHAVAARVSSSIGSERQSGTQDDVTILAREALAAIRARLAELGEEPRGAERSGQRAALWRAQHEAARRGRTLHELRRYCLDALRRPQLLDAEHENDYLRGYRVGLQQVLHEVRRIEGRRSS
jgi:hypothetical protein